MRFARLPTLGLCLSIGCAPYVETTAVPVPPAGTPIRYAARPDSTHFTKARLVALDAERLRFEQLEVDATGRRREWFERTVPTESLAVLQVRVRRRSNVGRGALIGAAVGLAAGAGCASEGGGWTNPEPGQCFVAGILGGAGYGALLGLLIRSDVWAPVLTPVEPASPRAVPPVTLLR